MILEKFSSSPNECNTYTDRRRTRAGEGGRRKLTFRNRLARLSTASPFSSPFSAFPTGSFSSLTVIFLKLDVFFTRKVPTRFSRLLRAMASSLLLLGGQWAPVEGPIPPPISTGGGDGGKARLSEPATNGLRYSASTVLLGIAGVVRTFRVLDSPRDRPAARHVQAYADRGRVERVSAERGVRVRIPELHDRTGAGVAAGATGSQRARLPPHRSRVSSRCSALHHCGRRGSGALLCIPRLALCRNRYGRPDDSPRSAFVTAHLNRKSVGSAAVIDRPQFFVTVSNGDGFDFSTASR